jgi:hypothetical protein
MQMGKQPASQAEQKRSSDAGGEVVIGVGKPTGYQVQNDECDADPDQRAEDLRYQHRVDEDLKEPDLDGLEGWECGDGDEAGQQQPAVRPQIRPEPPDHLSDRHRWGGCDDCGAFSDRREQPADSGQGTNSERPPSWLANGDAGRKDASRAVRVVHRTVSPAWCGCDACDAGDGCAWCADHWCWRRE